MSHRRDRFPYGIGLVSGLIWKAKSGLGRTTPTLAAFYLATKSQRSADMLGGDVRRNVGPSASHTAVMARLRDLLLRRVGAANRTARLLGLFPTRS